MNADNSGAAFARADQPAVAFDATALRKAYGATVALESADIGLAGGVVHALLGENGAGKSTLVRILTGAVLPDAGNVTLDGRNFAPRSLIEARASSALRSCMAWIFSSTVPEQISL